MKPLIVLVVAFILALVIVRATKKIWMIPFAGRIAMSVMLLFTAMGHFLYPEGMVLMLPDFIPFKKVMIYLTGCIEIAAANGLLIPRLRNLTGWLLIIFFIVILPANIHATIHHVNLETATNDGNGLNYLWFRIPLQVFYIGWVYFFAVKNVRFPANLKTAAE